MKMKRFAYLTVFVSAIVLFSCSKKDQHADIAFTPVGYWKGTIMDDINVAILNRPDGSSRLYIMVDDTATALDKYEGFYVNSASLFRASYQLPLLNFTDKLDLVSTHTGEKVITGTFTHLGLMQDNTPFTATGNFNVKKQP